jgi:uncharacterized protein (TIGR04255 family)
LTWFKADDVASKLGDVIGSDYPFCETQQEAQLMITPQGVTHQPGDTLYKLISGDRSWTVTLGSTFMALDTVKYSGHEDFIDRVAQVFDALLEAAPIPGLSRLGYRYTNRITDASDLAALTSYFRPDILGAIAQGEAQGLVHSANESVYSDGDGFLLVRTALLRPNSSIDPALPAVETKSWVLDLDAYIELAPAGLHPRNVRALAKDQADRARRHFRELITEDFRERFK